MTMILNPGFELESLVELANILNHRTHLVRLLLLLLNSIRYQYLSFPNDFNVQWKLSISDEKSLTNNNNVKFCLWTGFSNVYNTPTQEGSQRTTEVL